MIVLRILKECLLTCNNLVMNMETKFKVGDRVRILDCPIMPNMVGKTGIIRHKQEDLYRVEVDGKVIPDYALEADLELMPTNPFVNINE